MDAQTPLDGRVVMQGGTGPADFPHKCPYRVHGADKPTCVETSSNYQRNLAGCCGTSDSRGYAPCNAYLRKCHRCLAEGKGSKANQVNPEHIRSGLCEEHAIAALAPPKPAVKPRYVPTGPKVTDMPRLAPTTPKAPVMPRIEAMQTPAPAVPRPVVPAPAPKTVPAVVAPVVQKQSEPQRPVREVVLVSMPRTPLKMAAPVDAYQARYERIAREFDVDKAVQRLKRLTITRLDLARRLAAGEVVSSVNAKSMPSIKSSLCSHVGIPKMTGHGGLSYRMRLLRKAVERYDELQNMDPAHRAAPQLPKALVIDDSQEVELVVNFRLLSRADKVYLVQLAKDRHKPIDKSGE